VKQGMAILIDALPTTIRRNAGGESGVRRVLWSICMHAHQALCAARGHNYLRRNEKCRMFLECADCGHETHGWRIAVRVERT